jgi:hypothetical protein
MKKYSILSMVSASFALCGCAGVPDYGFSDDSAGNPVTIPHIVDRIQCEIFRAEKNHPALIGMEYVASASLTLEASDKIGVTPSLSFIDVLTAATNFTFGIGGEASDNRKRSFQESFNIVVANITDRPCALEAGSRLTGELGIEDLIAVGLTSLDPANKAILPTTDKFAAAKGAIFGSSITFTIVRNVNAVGPTWTLRSFKGPGSGSTGLANAGRTDTHTLLISFAPSKARLGIESTVARNNAFDAAQANNLDMRLQNIAPR